MSQVVYRFSAFVVDTGAHVLLKGETRLAIQEQPFQVLLALVENAGQVVTREALRTRLWGTDTFVDFDQSLNSAVRRLRLALEDNSRDPIFVETIPRVGFRFLPPVVVERSAPATVAPVTRSEVVPSAAEPLPMPPPPDGPVDGHSRRFPAALSALGAVLFAAGLLLGMLPSLTSRAERATDGVAIAKQSALQHAPKIACASAGSPDCMRLVAADESVGVPSPAGTSPAEMSELRGWYHLRERSDQGYRVAEQAFGQVLASKPQTPSAMVGLGEAEILMALNGDTPNARLRRAHQLGQQALALSPHMASAHALIGATDALVDWNDTAAEQEFRTALHLEPHDSLSHLWYGVFVLLPRQEYRAAEEQAQTAVREDPLSLIAHTDLGWILYSEGKREAALAEYRFVLQLDPQFVPAQFRMRQVQDSERDLPARVAAAALTQPTAKVENAAAIKVASNGADPLPVCAEAASAPAQGVRPSLPVLRAAVESHCPNAYFFGQDPELAKLKADPGFEALLNEAHPRRALR